jgi:hypothetical protein
MHYLLESKECENFGGIGLLIKGKSSRPHFDPSQSAASIAHDILEHTHIQVGNAIEDELMAIGAGYYIRYLGGYFNGYKYTDFKDFESDICQMLTHLEIENCPLSDPKQYFTRDKKVNLDFDIVIRKGINLYKEEYDDENHKSTFSKQTIKFIKGWLCKGYFYTKARYRNLDSCDLVYRFNTIERELASLFKSIEYEGQQFKVNINLQANKVKWSEIRNEEDYY